MLREVTEDGSLYTVEGKVLLWSRDRAGNIWEDGKRKTMPTAKGTSKLPSYVENLGSTEMTGKGRLCESRKEILPRDLIVMSGGPVEPK